MKMIKKVLSGLGKLISKGPTTPRPIGQVEITLQGSERRSFEGNLLQLTQPYPLKRPGQSSPWAVDLIVELEGEHVRVRIPTVTKVGGAVRRVHQSFRSIWNNQTPFSGLLLKGEAPFPRVEGTISLFEQVDIKEAA